MYLQNGDELKKRKDIPKDTILRSHELNIQEYRIQPLDILSVSFETLSDENDAFDFLSKLAVQQGRAGGGVRQVSSGIVVNTEGEIEFAVLGNIKVAGLTIFQAQDTHTGCCVKVYSGCYCEGANAQFSIYGLR